MSIEDENYSVKGAAMATKIALVVASGICITTLAIFLISDMRMFLIILVPVLTVLILFVVLIRLVSDYTITDNSITIKGERVPWSEVQNIKMYFQSKRFITLFYKVNGKAKRAILIADVKGSKETFIPKELRQDFQSDLEKLLESKIKNS